MAFKEHIEDKDKKKWLKCKCGAVYGQNGVVMRRDPSGMGYCCNKCFNKRVKDKGHE